MTGAASTETRPFWSSEELPQSAAEWLSAAAVHLVGRPTGLRIALPRLREQFDGD